MKLLLFIAKVIGFTQGFCHGLANSLSPRGELGEACVSSLVTWYVVLRGGPKLWIAIFMGNRAIRRREKAIREALKKSGMDQGCKRN